MSVAIASAFEADEASKRSFERCWRHFESELTHDLDAVMATIVKDETGRRDPVFWAVPGEPDASGAVKLDVFRGWSGARDVYRPLFEQARMVDAVMLLQLSASWWCFHQVEVEFVDREGRPFGMECAVIIRTDTEEDRVTGEMAWVFDRPAPPTEQTAKDRFGLMQSFAAALRGGDVDGILALMTDDVQGVVRERFGPNDGQPQTIAGKQQMRAAYESLYARASVVEVTPVQWYVGDPRYVLVDLHWTLELKGTGQAARSRTVEILPLGADGRFAARLGWGSPLSGS